MTTTESKELTFSEVKGIITFCEFHCIDDWREAVEQIVDVREDFELEDFRFIDSDSIDEIQIEELKSDLYMLGSFRAEFLAGIVSENSDYTSVYKAIEAAQKSGACEGIGAMALPYIEEIQEEYSSADGYGHHFAHYDHETLELFIGEQLYYVFKTN